MKIRLTVASLLVGVLALAGGFAWTASRSGEFALAEYSVQNLSCGSCVQNIRTALEGVEGVGQVEVSVTSGRARVEYISSAIDPETIAGRIEVAGYPAALIQNLSAEDYRLLRDDAAGMADRFVGRIGERLISRSEFAVSLSRYEEREAAPKGGLLKSVWQEILQRELLLGAAEENGVVVQDGEVDLQVRKMRLDHADFDAVVQAQFGGEENYRRQLKEEMIIQRNIEEHVLQDESDEKAARLKLDRWYRDLSAAVPVQIFDAALKTAVEGGGKGCGGSCCG